MNDDQAFKAPDIEFKRQLSPGYWRSYGHIYWRPLIVMLFGRLIIGRRALRKLWEAHEMAATSSGDCSTCRGEGVIADKHGLPICQACGGTGRADSVRAVGDE